MKNSKKLITTKAESELSKIIGFTGKYVSSLIASAQRLHEGDDVKSLLRTIKRKNKEARKAIAKKFGMSVKQYNELKLKATEILRDFETGHSMGCKGYLDINNNTFQSIDKTSNYANSCQWSATHGSFTLRLTKKQLISIEKIEGVWTIINTDGSAKWLSEKGAKNRYELLLVDGFFFGTTHSPISLDEAKRAEQLKIETQIKAIQNDSRFVGVQHLRAIGACEAGINAFCRKHNLNPTFGYNIGYLKSLENNIHLQKI